MLIYQGNLKPELSAQLTDEDGAPLNLLDAAVVRVVLSRDGSVVIDRASDTPSDGVTISAGGDVTMDWQPGDTNELGEYSVAIVIGWPDGEQTIALDETVVVGSSTPSPAPFVTYRMLTDHMSGRTFNASQESDARRGLRGLTRSLERHLQRRFVLAEVTELTFANEEGYALLARSPVKSILAVDGSLPGDVATFGFEGIQATYGGVLGLRPMMWHRVQYTGGGGLDPDDFEDVRLGILEKASQIMTTRHDDAVTTRALNVEEKTTRAPDSWAWTKAELEVFDRLRRKIVL